MDAATDYRCELILDAPPDRVFEAITALTGWWAGDADVAEEVGGRIRLTWSSSDYIEFRIDQHHRPVAVGWTCVSQHDTNLPETDERVGTRLSFRLREEAGTTSLVFVHHGLQPQLGCYDICDGG